MLQKEMMPLYIKPKDFEEGDLIFLPHKHQSIRITQKGFKDGCKMFHMEIYDHSAHHPQLHKKIEKESWFTPIFFPVCRYITIEKHQPKNE